MLIAVAVAFIWSPGLMFGRDPGYCTLVNSYQGPLLAFGFDGLRLFARTSTAPGPR